MNRTATVDQYAVIGFPIQHSRSPFIHGLFAQQTHQSMEYSRLEVVPEKLKEQVTRFFAQGGKGLNITVPHKQAIMPLLQHCSARAQCAGAVNTIIKLPDGTLLGDNTDGMGLLNDLRHHLQCELKAKKVLMLGAGGAARGVLAPLLEQAPEELVIANRTIERASQLALEFSTLGRIRAVSFYEIPHARFDLIINATSASLHGELPPLPTEIVGPQTLCYDMAYGKDDTAFTLWAKQQGAAQAVQGWGMLVEQAAEAFFLWRGIRPETQPVLRALINSI
jgi:shikimate dehydrogenase